MTGAQPVRLELRASGTLAAMLIAFHGMAATCFLTVLQGFPGFALAVLVLALGLAAAWDRALLRSAGSPMAILIHPDGAAQCLFADGTSAPVEASGAVSRHWVALRLGAPWRRSFLATGGMLSVHSFRLLRLWALWGKLPGVAPRQLSAAA